LPRTDPETRRKGAHSLAGNPQAVGRIVAAARLKPGESVLDVGAGSGAITKPLAAAVAPGGAVLAVEKEPDLVRLLEGLGLPGTAVVRGDALKVRLPARLDAVVANPPYRILPGLLRRLLDHGFGRAVLVVPRELGDRLTAQPGMEAYGKLTVQVGLRAKVKVLFPLKRFDFDPPPQVPSCVVEVIPKPAVPDVDWGLLDTVLDAAWAARRRTLRHSLAPLAQALEVPPQAVSEAIAATSTGARPAVEVSPWEYGVLAMALGSQVAARKAPSS
jgi:16S rRNA (adenine1518-N6/adenine1519-N6)-dimethyltransferase